MGVGYDGRTSDYGSRRLATFCLICPMDSLTLPVPGFSQPATVRARAGGCPPRGDRGLNDSDVVYVRPPRAALLATGLTSLVFATIVAASAVALVSSRSASGGFSQAVIFSLLAALLIIVSATVGGLCLFRLVRGTPLAVIDHQGIAIHRPRGEPLAIEWVDICDVSFQRSKDSVVLSLTDPTLRAVTVPTGSMTQQELGEEITCRWTQALAQTSRDNEEPMPLARPLTSEAADRWQQAATSIGLGLCLAFVWLLSAQGLALGASELVRDGPRWPLGLRIVCYTTQLVALTVLLRPWRDWASYSPKMAVARSLWFIRTVSLVMLVVGPCAWVSVLVEREAVSVVVLAALAIPYMIVGYRLPRLGFGTLILTMLLLFLGAAICTGPIHIDPNPDFYVRGATGFCLNMLMLLTLLDRRVAAAFKHPAEGGMDDLTDLSASELEDLKSEMKEALAMQSVLRPAHEGTATLVNNLGVLHEQQGLVDDAVQLYERALVMGEHGANHPELSFVPMLNNLASALTARGENNRSIEFFERSVAICERELDPRDPYPAVALQYLGLLYKRQGRYSEAEKCLLRSADLCEEAHGPSHEDVQASLSDLADLYQEIGWGDKLEKLNSRRRALQNSA